MGYILTFIAGGLIGVWTMCAMVQAGQADDREDMMLSRLTSCARCGHSDESCRWCRLLDMESAGIIEGYTVMINWDLIDGGK